MSTYARPQEKFTPRQGRTDHQECLESDEGVCGGTVAAAEGRRASPPATDLNPASHEPSHSPALPPLPAPAGFRDSMVPHCESISDSQHPSSSQAGDLARPPLSFFATVLRAAVVHVFIPFVNGIMLGFGEIAANELAFRYGWFGSRVVLFDGSSASVGVVRQQKGKGRLKDGEEGRGVVIGKGGAPVMQT